MKVETEKLVRVKRYADMKGVTTTAVYGWIEQGKVKSVKIDDVTFIMIEEDGTEE
mgnify:CR=1 FL=1